MSRKNILWLVSWYPNKNDRFDGDFIQRHARAAAIFHDVHVIFVTGAVMDKTIEETWNYVTGLTEQVVYFKRKTGFFGRLQNQWTWEEVFRKTVKKYIEKNGLPACVHVHIPWKAGLIGIWMKNQYTIPYILSEHWGIYNENVPDHFWTRSRIFQKMLHRIYLNSGALVSVSQFLDREVQGVMGKKADVIIPNVVDTSLFYFRDEKYSKFTFIHVSNMAPVKNVKSILDAFHNLLLETGRKDVQLLIVGNRDEQYHQLANSMGLLNTSVFFRGEIPYVDVADELRRSHCCVMFSTSETFSCVTAEALCCGVPVIASNTGALPELVNEENGILVPPNNVHQLGQSMKDILSGRVVFDQAQIAASASKKYGYTHVSRDFETLYDAVC